MRFHGKTAIITGSGRGIGLDVANIIASEGGNVIINDIDAKHLEKARAQLVASGANVTSVLADVTKETQVSSLVKQAVDSYGQIDILVNMVGGTYPCTNRLLDEITDEDWHNLMEINLTSNFVCSRAVIPFMQRRGYGRIVGVSSIAAVCGEPLLWSPPYGAAKAAVQGLVRQMAVEFGPYGITVNAVAQSDTMTERMHEHFEGNWPETKDEFLQRFDRYPIGRPSQPDEVARVIVFLASDESAYMTGETMLVTGGAYIE